jgi:hypothetical protein
VRTVNPFAVCNAYKQESVRQVTHAARSRALGLIAGQYTKKSPDERGVLGRRLYWWSLTLAILVPATLGDLGPTKDEVGQAQRHYPRFGGVARPSERYKVATDDVPYRRMDCSIPRGSHCRDFWSAVETTGRYWRRDWRSLAAALYNDRSLQPSHRLWRVAWLRSVARTMQPNGRASVSRKSRRGA